MPVALAITRWVLMLLLVAAGLLYLNSTVYSFWVAGGPPTDIPNAWRHRGAVHFGFSVALIATAVLVFRIVRAGQKINRSRPVVVWLIVLAVSLGYAPVKKLLQVDKCLDSGGEWNERGYACHKEKNT